SRSVSHGRDALQEALPRLHPAMDIAALGLGAMQRMAVEEEAGQAQSGAAIPAIRRLLRDQEGRERQQAVAIPLPGLDADRAPALRRDISEVVAVAGDR